MIDLFKQRSENVPLIGHMITHPAKRYEGMGLNKACKYTIGRLDKFKKHHGICQTRIYGEKISTDYKAADLFVDNLMNIVQENLTLEQIYNADETALFWQNEP